MAICPAWAWAVAFFGCDQRTAISTYARDGSLPGAVGDAGLGIEFLGPVINDGRPRSSGFLFSLVGNEPTGFAIAICASAALEK